MVPVGVGEDHCPVILLHKTFADGVVDKLEQGREIAVQIEQAARFLMVAELCPGEDFEELFQGAAAAGQGDKSIGQLDIKAFRSCMEPTIWRSVKPVWAISRSTRDLGMTPITSPPCARLFGNRSHQSDTGPAIDQGDARLRQGDAQFLAPSM